MAFGGLSPTNTQHLEDSAPQRCPTSKSHSGQSISILVILFRRSGFKPHGEMCVVNRCIYTLRKECQVDGRDLPFFSRLLFCRLLCPERLLAGPTHSKVKNRIILQRVQQHLLSDLLHTTKMLLVFSPFVFFSFKKKCDCDKLACI